MHRPGSSERESTRGIFRSQAFNSSIAVKILTTYTHSICTFKNDDM